MLWLMPFVRLYTMLGRLPGKVLFYVLFLLSDVLVLLKLAVQELLFFAFDGVCDQPVISQTQKRTRKVFQI